MLNVDGVTSQLDREWLLSQALGMLARRGTFKGLLDRLLHPRQTHADLDDLSLVPTDFDWWIRLCV